MNSGSINDGAIHPPVPRSLLISPYKILFTARSARLKEGRPVGQAFMMEPRFAKCRPPSVQLLRKSLLGGEGRGAMGVGAEWPDEGGREKMWIRAADGG